MKKIYLGLDIGGTKIACGGYLKNEKGHFEPTPIFLLTLKTQKGISHVCDALISLIEKAKILAKSLDAQIANAIGIGSPGHHIKGQIQPGTATNMGKTPEEFDNFNLKKTLKTKLNYNWHIENDAICQAVGALRLQEISSGKWIYLGPGTGLGGGIIRCQSKDTFKTIGNGHFFNYLLKIDPEDQYFSSHHIKKRIMAEKAISGTALYHATSLSGEQIASNPTTILQHHHIFEVMGKYLLQLIIQLSKKYHTKNILIGGSLGTKPPLNILLLQPLQLAIITKQLDITIKVIENTTHAATLGALLCMENVSQ